jgi:hypothetical protein
MIFAVINDDVKLNRGHWKSWFHPSSPCAVRPDPIEMSWSVDVMRIPAPLHTGGPRESLASIPLQVCPDRSTAAVRYFQRKLCPYPQRCCIPCRERRFRFHPCHRGFRLRLRAAGMGCDSGPRYAGSCTRNPRKRWDSATVTRSEWPCSVPEGVPIRETRVFARRMGRWPSG